MSEMNNLDKIIDSIIKDTDTKIAEIESASQKEIDDLTKANEYKISDARKFTENKAAREIKAISERAKSTAEMNRRIILLDARDKMIEQAYAEAEQYLYNLDRDKYTEMLARLLSDAAEQQLASSESMEKMYGEKDEHSTDFSVAFNENDKKTIAKEVVKRAGEYLAKKSPKWKNVNINIADGNADIKGGLILQYGDIETNCSISSIIRGERNKTDADVANILFGKAD